MSFFGRLLRAGSAKRLRLEDFLTEVLAELLNALPRESVVDFCDHAFLSNQPEASRSAWRSTLKHCDYIAAKTQESIHFGAGQKRPDLMLYADSCPVMLIECKVAAGFTAGSATEEGADAQRQLPAYDAWLSRNAADAALVLLTHITAPPDGFCTTTGSYKVALRSARRWSDVHRILTRGGDDLLGPSGCRARLIASELAELLEEENMAQSDPSLQDIALLQLYLMSGACDRVVAPINAATQRLKIELKDYSGFTQGGSAPVSRPPNEAWISGWAYSQQGGALHWGIMVWSAEADDPEWSSGIGLQPNQREVFYVKASIGAHRSADSAQWGNGWYLDTDGEGGTAAFKAVPVCALLAGDDVGQRVTEWLVTTAHEANHHLQTAEVLSSHLAAQS